MVDLSALETQLFEDLAPYFEKSDGIYDADLLQMKVKHTIKMAYFARKYPSYYSEEQILNDMEAHYPIIYENIIEKYGKIGMEGEQSRNENGINIVFADAKSLIKGILPLAKF